MKKIIKKVFLGVCAALVMVAGGCAPKNVTYFQEFDPNSIQEVATRAPFRIKPDDKLSIMVYTSDDQLSRLFNLGLISNRANTGANAIGASLRNRTYVGAAESYSSYTVSSTGYIDFPQLGELKVAGMTREELCGFIKGELEAKNLVQDPIVIVEYLNMGVNVMGEVRVPGRYDINANTLTILDALTLAGDLNLTADRENVKVLREKDGKVEVHSVDLTKGKSLLNSPVYYLEQGDIIYVEPNTMRKRSTTVNGNTALSAGFWVSVASLLTSVAVLIFK